ncbi:MAG TPA: hypothetical protein VJV96_03285 [Candidatus Angelobacter sp.]|jgi:hypothetical protein|nr:hypothetical protein [Candidatus Angelobacter sp.]
MKTRWESFVFILLMLLPAICLLNTGTRPVAPVAANTVSRPCSSETTLETRTGGSEHDHEGVLPQSGNAAGVSSGSSIQSTTGKISK